jgi:hypothetical protein
MMTAWNSEVMVDKSNIDKICTYDDEVAVVVVGEKN